MHIPSHVEGFIYRAMELSLYPSPETNEAILVNKPVAARMERNPLIGSFIREVFMNQHPAQELVIWLKLLDMTMRSSVGFATIPENNWGETADFKPFTILVPVTEGISEFHMSLPEDP